MSGLPLASTGGLGSPGTGLRVCKNLQLVLIIVSLGYNVVVSKIALTNMRGNPGRSFLAVANDIQTGKA